ncbi:MAG: DUF2851 family protein [Prolixibacteraceae bacterium]|jgi:hypothetical protein|nr:DUF2851 family protein [Prolixibacteraceae bacterium]
MNEEFFQFAWRHQFFSKENLCTTKGLSIEIVNPGTWNTNSGPDFFNAKIKIGTTLWGGNVEIHKKASDWIRHKHQNDDAYSNVILHVVVENDCDVKSSNGRQIPTMLLDVDSEVQHNYQTLLNESNRPACNKSLHHIDPIYVRSTLDSMLIDRIQSKTYTLTQTLRQSQNNWNEAFYLHLAMNFGFKVNALPFEMLSRSLPLTILAHHTSSLIELEALLFGQSGLLNEQLLGDDYFLMLRKEYSYFSRKYNLKGMEGHVWKFMRLRPANFPTIRIAQFASLLYQSENLFSKLLELKTTKEILNLFKINASSYWDTHYRFNHLSNKKLKKMGQLSQFNLIINTVVPFLYLYGERSNKDDLKTRALELLEVIPSEKNKIITQWSKLGIKSANAYDSHALIQLKNVYCDYKKCLNCQIGIKVINR